MTASQYWCPYALLRQGWAQSVLFEVNTDGNIVTLREGVNGSDKSSAQILDGPVIPGMPNLHSHVHQRAMAGLGEKASSNADSFWSWRQVMYHMLRQISPEQLYDIARMLYLEMLQAGYTHVAEFQYLHHDPAGNQYDNPAEMTLQCLRAARDVGIGFTALPVLYRYGGFGSIEPDDGQRRFINDLDGYLDIWSAIENVLVRNEAIGLTPHSLRAIDAELLGSAIQAVSPACKIHLHIAEQTREVDDCLAWSDKRPVNWLYDNFDVDGRWCLIHATHLEDAEIERFARSGAAAGLCPTTEANLGDGFFSATKFLRDGGTFGIGSDSQISVSVTEELRWLEYGQRLLSRQRNRFGDKDLFAGSTGEGLYRAALAGGQSACGIAAKNIAEGSRVGLAEGQPATWLVLDDSHPRLLETSPNSLLDAWIFSAGDSAVDTVFVAGRPVILDGHHQNEVSIKKQFHSTLKQLSLA